MIFINFKTYEAGTGANALDMIKLLEEVAQTASVKIVPVLQPTDIKEAVLSSKLEIWSQKIDPVEYGAHTGAVLPEAVFEDGASGVFLNHSEVKFENFGLLEKAHRRAKDVGLKTLVFASSISEFQEVAKLSPSFIAYEPPEFIGRTDISVATAQPEIIAKVAVMAKDKGLPLIVGAGVHTQEDVRISLKLGAVGVAVAKDIMTADDPKKEILDLVSGFE